MRGVPAATSEKEHFVLLDGLRGIAALAVGFLHAQQMFEVHGFPGHTWLAVDFFFCLSGFVVACAYDGRLASGMSLASFFEKRVIRLYPMIFLGVWLGALITYISATHGHGLGPMWVFSTLTAGALLMIPAGLLFGLQAYPLNNPLWSLFFEFAASLLYGLECRLRRGRTMHTGRWRIAMVAGIVAIFAISWAYHRLETVGFGSWSSFLFGFARVTCPFFIGVLIYRLRLWERVPSIPALGLAALLAVVLLAPPLVAPWLYDATVVVVGFPIIVAMGAKAKISGRAAKFWSMAGAVSYPFYAIHFPLLKLFSGLYHHGYGARLSPEAVALASLMVAVATSYTATVLYETPARHWLAGLLRRPSHAPATA